MAIAADQVLAGAAATAVEQVATVGAIGMMVAGGAVTGRRRGVDASSLLVSLLWSQASVGTTWRRSPTSECLKLLWVEACAMRAMACKAGLFESVACLLDDLVSDGNWNPCAYRVHREDKHPSAGVGE